MKENTGVTLARVLEQQKELPRLEKELVKLQKQCDTITAQREELAALFAERKKPICWARDYGASA